jgi:hypothetical protein
VHLIQIWLGDLARRGESKLNALSPKFLQPKAFRT